MAAITSYMAVSLQALEGIADNKKAINDRFREILVLKLGNYCAKRGVLLKTALKNIAVDRQAFCYILSLKGYYKE